MWRFTEGTNGTFFETYLLLANARGAVPAATTLTFTKTDGTVVTATTTVPAWGRVNVWVRGLPGMATGDFRTVASVTNGVPIFAERATYWPVGSDQVMLAATGLAASLATMPAVSTAGFVTLQPATADARPAVQTFDPYAAATAHGKGPRLYERLVGYSGRVASTADAPLAAADTGPPVSGAGTTSATPAAGTALTTTVTTTITWYGAHLTGGRRQ